MDYLKIRELCEKILVLIKKNSKIKEPNTVLLTRNLNSIISIIDKREHIETTEVDIKNIIKILFTSNKDIGIRNFHIWKDDYVERIEINNKLKELVENLEKFNSGE